MTLRLKEILRYLVFVLLCAGMISGLSAGAFQPGWAAAPPPPPLTPSDSGLSVYLPAVVKPAPPAPPQYAGTRIVNAPNFGNSFRFSESAILWFGRISPSENYIEVRVGYTTSSLILYLSVFDRLLWFDTTPASADLLNWDAVSLLLDTQNNAGGAPTASSYRLDTQLASMSANRVDYQAGYRGNGGTWSLASVPFSTTSGVRWESGSVGGTNNNQNNRGWVASYNIPFSSLGLNSAPSEGTIWRLGIAVHDRESQSTPASDIKTWPEQFNESQPSSWGQLRFGLPVFTPPVLPEAGSVMVREGISGQHVQDAAVGGTTGNLCPSDPNYIWNQWGNVSFGSAEDFNIQNQSDLADWPCFSKYYVTFPLGQMPSGKTILSAEVTLHLFGGSDPSQADESYIQVMEIGEDWNENSLTWNNAPLAIENIAGSWVQPTSFPGWPGIAYHWDVSLAVARAYASGKPLRLVMYSADGPIHSGKYFVASNGGNWSAGEVSRPTLTVHWGNP
jgi:hypothetical protein